MKEIENFMLLIRKRKEKKPINGITNTKMKFVKNIVQKNIEVIIENGEKNGEQNIKKN